MSDRLGEQSYETSLLYLFDGTASLLLPLVAAQLQGAMDVGFSVIGAQDEQSEEPQQKHIQR